MRERLQWILNVKAERKRGSLRDQSAMMDIADESHAHGIAFCIGAITGQTKEEVLAEYTPKPRRTIKKKKRVVRIKR